MREMKSAIIRGEDGLNGTVEEIQTNPDQTTSALVHLDNGQRILVPTSMMVEEGANSYYLPMKFTDIAGYASDSNADAVTVIPIIEEVAEIQKRVVTTGKVRVRKTVREHEETIDEPLLQEQVDVERVAVNKIIDQPVAVRTEGDTIIVPLVEEVLVVEKRLMLREEIRITKRAIETHDPQTVVLRSEEVEVERVSPTE